MKAPLGNRRTSDRSGNAAKPDRASSIDDVLLQPWFLPRRTADAIRGIVTASFYRKMHYYFDDYGCMLCGKESEYCSNGMCRDCYKRVLFRLKHSLMRRRERKPRMRLDLILFRQQKLAKTLLKGLAPVQKVPRERLTLKAYRTLNPVYEAFSAHHE